MTAGAIIIGAGGHGRVLADSLLLKGLTSLGFTDADANLWGTEVLGLPVIGSDSLLEADLWAGHVLVNGIGAGPARRRIQARFEAANRIFVGTVHPCAVISPFARVHPTAQILARAVIQAGAEVGPGSIVNTGAIIEHDCSVGDFTHCAPGSILCGGVRTGSGVHVGAGAVVREGVWLGDEVFVGAGAVVVSDHRGPCRVWGVPARVR